MSKHQIKARVLTAWSGAYVDLNSIVPGDSYSAMIQLPPGHSPAEGLRIRADELRAEIAEKQKRLERIELARKLVA